MALIRIISKDGSYIDVPAIRGYSAYQVAVAIGAFVGTEAEWLESLKGDPYELTDPDKEEIKNKVVENMRPDIEAVDARVDVLEADAVDTETRLAILENAVANYSKLQVEKVNSIEEMTSPDIIYLLPSADGSYYYEYLLYNGVPEIIGNTDIDLTNYVTKDAFNQTKLYRHNVLLYYRHVNPELTQVGSDGHFQIAFTLINNDSKSYSFKHNVTGNTPTIMGLDEAWQSTRLYRALPQNTRDENASYMPSSGSALICEGTSAPLKISTCISNYLLGTYYNNNGNWERRFKIHFSKVDGTTIAGAVLHINCGHPIFDDNGNETSLWATKEEFEANEYNTYASYFCQNRIHCVDTVEELSLSTID